MLKRDHPRIGWCVSVLAASIALVAAGCGSDDDTDTSTAANSTPTAQADTAANKPNAAPKTVGVTAIAVTSYSVSQVLDAVKRANETLGWKTESCDPQGDLAKTDTCVSQLLTKGADAIVSVGTPASLMRKGLASAEAKGVPVINTGGTADEPDAFAGSYAPDDTKLGGLLAQQIASEIQGGSTVGAFFQDAVGALKLRGDALREAAQGGSFSVKEVTGFDQADPVRSSQRATESFLRANPDTAGIWVPAGTTYLPGVSAGLLAAQKTQDVSIYGFYADPASLDLITSGKVKGALADVNIGRSGWVAVDQLLAHFENDRPIEPTSDASAYTYKIVTKSDPGTANEEGDFGEPFLKRWATEYK
jgi:ABC-type sugar transport system substrate-binding protein